MDTVELHTAFMWDCNECGTENFERAIRPELSEEEIQEMREDFDLQEGEEGFFLMAPKEVVCSTCGTKYQTEEQI